MFGTVTFPEIDESEDSVLFGKRAFVVAEGPPAALAPFYLSVKYDVLYEIKNIDVALVKVGPLFAILVAGDSIKVAQRVQLMLRAELAAQVEP